MKLHMLKAIVLITCWAASQVTAADNAPMLVDKQSFSMKSLTTFGGKTIQNVKVGWESYGTLNDKKDNVILITHYFSGTSHAAGKYSADDEAPGYWDAIIGPGKAIDTNKFYVISVDSLANLNAYDDNVITTGPASINPETGKPYGLSFPVVTIRDFVNVQKAVLESQGITSLYAVIGPSMGSMQALEWASAYPEWVPRMVSVIGSGESDAWTTAALSQWAMPIKLDPRWDNGNYTREAPPAAGLAASLMLITQHALYPDFFNQQGQQLGYTPLEAGPLNDIREQHTIVRWLQARAESRSAKMDANHLLYLVRACQLYVAGNKDTLEAGLKNVAAKTLFLPATNDLLLMPYMAKKPFTVLSNMNKQTRYQELEGGLGHLEGVVDIAEQASMLAEFLKD